MSVNWGLFSTIYLISGFVFGVWFTYSKLRGGENSLYAQEMRKRVPGAHMINPWFLFLGAAISVIAYSAVWPYYLVRNLAILRRNRIDSRPLHLHPKLAKLRSAMKNNEENYPEILSTFELDAVVVALHAIDLPAAVDRGLRRIGEKRAEMNGGDPAVERPSSDDYEEASYVNVIRVALGFTEFMALDATKKRANLRRVVEITGDLAKRFDHIRNPGRAIGELIAYHVHGWARESALKALKEYYSLMLKPEFRNADHMATVFSGIRSLDDRDVSLVTAKGADVTDEEYAEFVTESRRASGDETVGDQPAAQVDRDSTLSNEKSATAGGQAVEAPEGKPKSVDGDAVQPASNQ